MRDAPAKATFTAKGAQGETGAQAEVIGGEGRIAIRGGKSEDAFGGYEVKLYRIR